MDAGPLWNLFRFTGEPLAYMLYRAAECREDLESAV